MPIISSYKLNNTPEPSDILIGTDVSNGQTKNFNVPSDILIGTDVSNGQTKNFNVQSLSNEAINNYLKQISWQFIAQDPDPDPRPEGTISFENYGGAGTAWSAITSLYINTNMVTALNSLPYLQRLVNLNVIINDRRDISRYGVYTLNSLTQVDSSSVYEMDLTFILGNSVLTALQYYSIQIDSVENADKHFEFTQGTPSTQWDKFPSISVVDTAGTTVIGSYDYINADRVTLNFSTPFAGKAFLN
jgi:hypothetical protein